MVAWAKDGGGIFSACTLQPTHLLSHTLLATYLPPYLYTLRLPLLS